jgi:exosome complex RNA-binding protein Rrp4
MEDELIEKYAIRIALGNNGGIWETHYTEKQKERWRALVRDLVRDIKAELQ